MGQAMGLQASSAAGGQVTDHNFLKVEASHIMAGLQTTFKNDVDLIPMTRTHARGSQTIFRSPSSYKVIFYESVLFIVRLYYRTGFIKEKEKKKKKENKQKTRHGGPGASARWPVLASAGPGSLDKAAAAAAAATATDQLAEDHPVLPTSPLILILEFTR